MTEGGSLNHYTLGPLIGRGGMGEVYRATDTRLGREVALKLLPAEFSRDSERLARFRREAQILASLNHANIAAIHGLEESGETSALVLELVPGPTLDERIARGPIPVDEALGIAEQILAALQAAHEAGVVHRDLKPVNVKLRDDGTVKVLDFGLARALEQTGPELSQSPTLTAGATRSGVILGTAAYMAPEQARGQAVDRRADVWAFGALLYEMLTGRRAFEGGDVSEVLASVLRDQPDLDALPADVPARVRRTLEVCLRKDPRERIRDVSALRLALGGASETETPSASLTPSRGPWRHLSDRHPGPRGRDGAGADSRRRGRDACSPLTRRALDRLPGRRLEGGGIFVRAYPDAGAARHTVRHAARQPPWNPRGGELFFWDHETGLTAVRVDTAEGFRVHEAKSLFDLDDYVYNVGRNYSVAPDGKSFVLVRRASRGTRLVVVQNWAQGL